MRAFAIAVLIILLGYTYYYFDKNQEVTVINSYYNGSTAWIIVDALPFTDAGKIHWWQHNQDQIRRKYHIPTGAQGPFLITIYAFGEGYQEEGKEDRLCFPNVEPPRNCIDKNILMTIWRTREGGIKYNI
jgi:hypothetical protein